MIGVARYKATPIMPFDTDLYKNRRAVTALSTTTEDVNKKPLIADKDLFARWLFLLVEQIVCGVMVLLPDPLGLVQRTAFFISGHINENYRLLDWVKDTEWNTTYWTIVGVFFAAVAFTAVALFVDRFKRGYVLCGMLVAQVIFFAANLTVFYVFKPILESRTIVGIPWEVSWTNTGYIYLVVSVFAVIELIMTMLALRKRAKQAAKEKQEEGETVDDSGY